LAGGSGGVPGRAASQLADPALRDTKQLLLARALPAGCGGWHDDGVDYLLAQVNIGRLLAPLDSAQLADFVAALDPVNAAAEAAPGFVWRLLPATGHRGLPAGAQPGRLDLPRLRPANVARWAQVPHGGRGRNTLGSPVAET
jgi:hypothetical protein